MNILDKIIVDKKREVILKKTIIPVSQLENSVLFGSRTVSLSKILRNSNAGIIAEHKRRSPSKAEINYNFSVEEVVKGYQNAGVCGISVLTDAKYFGGSLDDLLVARASINIPLLRKEFIIDEYQILEAKAHGADLILLIAAVLTREEIKNLSEFAQSLGLEVLLEVHNLEELQKSIMPTLDMIGVNNRNLKTFEVSLDFSKQLASEIPDEFVKVSESGISSIEAINELKPYGYKGFLIGENFMKTDNPGKAAEIFIKNLI
ncbi:indole-3-glycerol phosphate synthase TrpC [Flavobacterium psychrophilum]|uniref:indole-3-glycerol phosphate synthase TrpC n=1 Tax=Flavobacterium psychrophilum TaxID=96345 RepID=UPI0004F78C43|nr:indole-3-glycerol phosphate synthase TrpC [Flavobacterium psychrophilum]AIN73774.1 indole-3-glycerol phosphate synthase [Flavobacterium psychrophilum FPG3]EKT3963273.1 indole-3-glycerol phosphate synthase TrpC [Flavobacterium psychrophilum]EKT3966125.1 indole-3-glycerol phosphate synthase TrpC [Flavobacterium psychrophilum]EKT4499120.1 indole-3-glycerol phosphate synthase TrpC [Flavobacterium psychrophilum]EKT4516728.1 indole-3-glycerol phosphate synthase TrpC [Flavobacterium psychrophilum]